MIDTNEYQPLLDELTAAMEARLAHVAPGAGNFDRAADHAMLTDISARMDDLAALGCPKSAIQAALHAARYPDQV